jgi:hypothetical protein
MLLRFAAYYAWIHFDQTNFCNGLTNENGDSEIGAKE